MPQNVLVVIPSQMFSLHMPKSAILMCPSESSMTLSSFKSLQRSRENSGHENALGWDGPSFLRAAIPALGSQTRGSFWERSGSVWWQRDKLSCPPPTLLTKRTL